MKFISNYSNGNVGVAQELVRYLAEKGESFFYLEHPLTPATGRSSRLDTYDRGIRKDSTSLGRPRTGSVGHYLQCMWLTFRTVRTCRRSVTRFIGHSNLDCVAAALAGSRSMKVLYVSIDYTPKRFANPVFNAIYRMADRLAYRWADAVWHSYPDFLQLKPYAPPDKCFVTLHGNNFRRIARPPWSERATSELVYLGGLSPFARLERVLEAVARLRERFPDIRFHAIGAPAEVAYGERLRTRARDIGVADRVVWHGQITRPEDFENIMTGLGVALCLYEMNPDLPSYYQLPGKVFAYAACGLPTIVLDRSGPIAVREIERNRIGLVASLDGLEDCVARLFSDPERHRSLAENAVRWAGRFDWNDKFDKYLGLLKT
jgi:glycosyltransferase involved in cell wall biosynthesis